MSAKFKFKDSFSCVLCGGGIDQKKGAVLSKLCCSCNFTLASFQNLRLEKHENKLQNISKKGENWYSEMIENKSLGGDLKECLSLKIKEENNDTSIDNYNLCRTEPDSLSFCTDTEPPGLDLENRTLPVCMYCCKVFSSEQDFSNHQNCNATAFPLECLSCDEVFSNLEEHSFHQKSSHDFFKNLSNISTAFNKETGFESINLNCNEVVMDYGIVAILGNDVNLHSDKTRITADTEKLCQNGPLFMTNFNSIKPKYSSSNSKEFILQMDEDQKMPDLCSEYIYDGSLLQADENCEMPDICSTTKSMVLAESTDDKILNGNSDLKPKFSTACDEILNEHNYSKILRCRLTRARSIKLEETLSGNDFTVSDSDFKTSSSIVSYIRKSYKCTSCGQIYNNKKSFMRHQKVCVNKHKTPTCDNYFTNSDFETSSSMVSNIRKSYKCTSCGQIYYNKKSFMRHQKVCVNKHKTPTSKESCKSLENPETLKCKLCGMSFTYQSSLYYHWYFNHQRINKPFKFLMPSKLLSVSKCINKYKKQGLVNYSLHSAKSQTLTSENEDLTLKFKTESELTNIPVTQEVKETDLNSFSFATTVVLNLTRTKPAKSKDPTTSTDDILDGHSEVQPSTDNDSDYQPCDSDFSDSDPDDPSKSETRMPLEEKTEVTLQAEVTQFSDNNLIKLEVYSNNLAQRTNEHPRSLLCSILTKPTCTDSGKLVKADIKKRIQIVCSGIVYKCRQCTMTFGNSEDTLEHEIAVHDTKRFTCDLCKFSAITEDLLKDHVRLHFGQRFLCTMCPTFLKTKRTLARHLLTHSIKKHVCKYCSKSFRDDYSLRNHEYVHVPTMKKFNCQECEQSFPTSRRLKNHIDIVHKKLRPFECKICHRAFSSSGGLNRHVDGHNNVRRFKCEVCDKAFNRLPCLKKHLSCHTLEKPFSCKVCGSRFRTYQGLGSHELIHSEVKLFLCDLCGRSFTTKVLLNRHLVRFHYKLRKFSCEICNKTFLTNFDKRRHLRLHTGEKPYVCDICGHACVQKSTLDSHIRVHHKDILLMKTELP